MLRPSPNPPASGYRKNVGAVLFDRNGLVFAGQRADMDRGGWQLPQGGVNEGEPLESAILRELAEETGIRSVRILAESRNWLTYDFPDALSGSVWKGRFQGQAQKWFALRFTGGEDEIDLNAGPHPEFRAWRWVPLTEMPDLIVPFKRPVYEALVAEFLPLAVPERP